MDGAAVGELVGASVGLKVGSALGYGIDRNEFRAGGEGGREVVRDFCVCIEKKRRQELDVKVIIEAKQSQAKQSNSSCAYRKRRGIRGT